MSEKNSLRWFKKYILARPQSLWIQASAGFKDQLREELLEIEGLSFEESLDFFELNSVAFRDLFSVIWRLRTPRDIYWKLSQAKVSGFAELKKLLENFPSMFFDKVSFETEVRSYRSRLFHEKALTTALKDELEKKGYASDPSSADFRLRLELKDNQATLLLAAYREPFYKRQVVQAKGFSAPLAENIAACLMRWYIKQVNKTSASAIDTFYIPFAGSGSFVWESFSFLNKTNPHLFSKPLSLEKLRHTPEASASYAKRQLIEGLLPKSFSIVAVEKNESVFKALEENLAIFQKLAQSVYPELATNFDFLHGDFFHWQPEPNSNLAVLINPPYGLRLENEKGDNYRAIAERLVALKASCKYLSGLVLIPNDRCFQAFSSVRSEIIKSTQSFSQGGQHIRAVFFEA